MACCAGVCSPAFCRLIAVSSDVSPARAFICSETTVKEGWRASFSAVRVSSSEEYSRTSRPLRARPFRVALSIAICVTEANTVALSLTECPGVSTQPFSSFSAVNGESLTGREAGSARPGTTTVIASSLTDATCRRSPPETRSPGIFPVTLSRSPSATGIFSGRNSDQLLSREEIRTTCVSPCASRRVRL
ncbi:Uncharacterised protein [Shigella sonnei]|nr:Uncharacterised protein [Shigella sonnei]SJF16199.1 Uncharacterised protein [Shigella sonnei]SXU58276.1 Uncharacterised protein [Klebsiella pneumoniae]VUI25241.1 Uncharacterised protein [Klebsiella pneumoniae]